MDKYLQNVESTLHLLDNRPNVDFEGLSKADMRYLIHNPFSEDSPLQINKSIPTKVLAQIRFLNQIEFLLKRMTEIKQLKLTGKGFLPTAFVKEIYNQHYIKDEMIEDKSFRLYHERNSDSVHHTRLFAEKGGLLINIQNKLSLSPEWRDIALQNNKQNLFNRVFSTFTQKFNWNNIGFSPNPNTSQIGFAFSLFLLSKYGNVKRINTFYINKYIRAFPFPPEELVPIIYGVKHADSFPFSFKTRTIECFFYYFNLAEYKYVLSPEHQYNVMIKKSKIFDDIVIFD